MSSGRENGEAVDTLFLIGNRTQKQLDSDFNGTVNETISYLYDANDRLQTEEQDVNNDSAVDVTATYNYNHTQETSKSVFDNSASPATSEQTFAYDLQGHRLEVVTKNFSGGTLSQHERVIYDYDTIVYSCRCFAQSRHGD